ncbi:MAG: hypothetical protein EOP05_19745, partial [Proteobacteria bacterium]
MELAQKLDLVSRKLYKMPASESNKRRLESLATYLKAQALSDTDRRDPQHLISEAAQMFVKCLYQVSLQASLNQKQEFWESLEKLSKTRLEIKVRPHLESPVGSERWDSRDLLVHLDKEVAKQTPNLERDRCLLAIRELVSEASKPAFERNSQANK